MGRNNIAQELEGDTSEEVQSGQREGKWTTGGREVTGALQYGQEFNLSFFPQLSAV